MTFDVFLQHFRNGESVSAPREGVLQVLRDGTCCGPDEFGVYLIDYADGRSVEFCGIGLEDEEDFCGCAFLHCTMDDALMDLIYRVAKAADMVAFPSIEGHLAVTLTDEQAAHLPSDVYDNFQTVVVKSSRELASVLEGGYDAWVASGAVEPQMDAEAHRR